MMLIEQLHFNKSGEVTRRLFHLGVWWKILEFFDTKEEAIDFALSQEPQPNVFKVSFSNDSFEYIAALHPHYWTGGK